ncbi:hypothetical protein SRB5_46630 [Streptomyces sp. RB5]|uniref:AAA+ ATPase domain-containing protein n=1 Tax=Streptomyces smaragdinus TaxID=2585196 RepID=A0A7K0CLY4_9ACTN|nr:DNA/RNA helicase domain-containing protein [Streptomyces smaragdinus]MQY14495.1 hypothetical protein [Streptomyces smaragdinus]
MAGFRALLIGATDYQDDAIPSLPFVPEDMAKIGKALEERGFDPVDLRRPERGTTAGFVVGTVTKFLNSARPGDLLLVMFSGHGVHFQGDDYLLPEDAHGHVLDRTGIKLDWSDDISTSAAERVVFCIDACREGIQRDFMAASGISRWTKRKIGAAAKRKVAYVYACSPGEVARFVTGKESVQPDDDIGTKPGDSFSLFSRALADTVAATRISTLEQLEQHTQDRIDRMHHAYGKPGVPQQLRVLTDVDKGDFLVFPGPPPTQLPELSMDPTQPITHFQPTQHPMLSKALDASGLRDVSVLMGFALPLSSTKISAILAGQDPVSGEPSYVVVELKDWNQVAPADGIPALCQADGGSEPVLNPVEQVRAYVDYLTAFHETLSQHPDRVSGVVLLPNTTNTTARAVRSVPENERGRAFTADQADDFADYLRRRLVPSPTNRATELLVEPASKPTTQLLKVAAREIIEHEQFILLDAQREAYELVLGALRKADSAGGSEVVVVTGGPGSGKSVIALSLLGELFREGRKVMHATGSQSFTKTLRKLAGHRRRNVQALFKYFNSFMTDKHGQIDVLICDEAHRLRETSVNRWTRSEQRKTNRSQIDELIDAAKVTVFLLDEHQVVRPGEVGTVAAIKAATAARGVSCTMVSLADQFRCGGSEAYLQWVLNLLGLSRGNPGPTRWQPDGKVILRMASTPAEMEAFLKKKKDDNLSARISAGYCWEWTKKPLQDGSLATDVTIGDWAKPWNVPGDKAVNGAPPSALWATDPGGFGQVGCVYTAQGFEYDWSGVILGPDLVWRTDKWVLNRDASWDPAFTKTTPDAEVDRLIRNAYKVLLTRGKAGTIVYSTDAETRELLHRLIG